MNVSVITTVYNEAEDVASMLDSLLEQSREPDEIIVVDGGSDDGTWSRLQEYADDHDHIRVLQEPCNIAEGRNIAIEAAKYDIILGIDGGCIADQDWVEHMLEPFEAGADAVAGMFESLKGSVFETVQGAVVTSSYDRKALERGERAPSSRSIGFRKQVWDDVGGYPEDLYTGEDTKFNRLIQQEGYEFEPAPDAVVRWHMRPTWSSLWRQYRQYGEGDAEAHNTTDHPSNLHGVSKNLLLIGSQLIGIAGIISSFMFPYTVVIGVIGLGAPYIYHLPQLFSTLGEEGVKALPYWYGVVTVKTWGYMTGFIQTWIRDRIPGL